MKPYNTQYHNSVGFRVPEHGSAHHFLTHQFLIPDHWREELRRCVNAAIQGAHLKGNWPDSGIRESGHNCGAYMGNGLLLSCVNLVHSRT
jgi:hypothetical protein